MSAGILVYGLERTAIEPEEITQSSITTATDCATMRPSAVGYHEASVASNVGVCGEGHRLAYQRLGSKDISPKYSRSRAHCSRLGNSDTPWIEDCGMSSQCWCAFEACKGFLWALALASHSSNFSPSTPSIRRAHHHWHFLHCQ